jgi:NAD(P)-dependent dehydrogenase (short-subunit alcohol dehydrogenase family)
MPDELSPSNRPTIAVITGGTQGLGLAIAKRLALEGAPGIVISGRNRDSGEKAAKEVQALGTECLFVQADMSIIDDCHRLIDSCLKHFRSINGLVNSAAATDRGNLLDTTVEIWDRHFNTNVRGPFLIMQRMVAHLVETGKPGSIVNILSMAAHCGQS